METGIFTVGSRATTARVRAGSHTRWDALLYPATAIAAFLLLWLRRPEALSSPRLWAQDGTVFYATYLVNGTIRSLFEPNNGFLNVIPRLLTAVVGSTSAVQIPLVFAAISLVGVALSCAFFALPEYRYFLRSDQLRIACCLAFAAVPYGYDEVGTLASLSWYACIPAMLLLALPRRGYNGRPFWFMLGGAILVTLTALSSPALFVFLPMAMFKIYKGTSRVRIVSGLFVGAMIVQLMVLRVASHGTGTALDVRSIAANIFNVVGYRVALGNLIGRFASSDLSAGHALALSIVTSAIVLIAALIYLETRKEAAMARRLAYILFAAIASVVITCVASGLNGDAGRGGQWNAWQEDRYFLVPTALLYYVVARACDDFLRGRATESFRALAFISLITIAAVSNFRLQPVADDDWASHAPLIDQWRAAQLAGQTHSALDLPINPPGWTIYLPALQAAS